MLFGKCSLDKAIMFCNMAVQSWCCVSDNVFIGIICVMLVVLLRYCLLESIKSNLLLVINAVFSCVV